MAKVFKNDAYSLGILYVYLYSGKSQLIVSLEALDSFYNYMEDNLSKMDTEDVFLYGLRYEEQLIYTISEDENGNKFCILNNNADIDKAINNYIETVPKNHLVASQMSNALDALGLINVDDKIQLKRKMDNQCPNYQRQLTYNKHNKRNAKYE